MKYKDKENKIKEDNKKALKDLNRYNKRNKELVKRYRCEDDD